MAEPRVPVSSRRTLLACAGAACAAALAGCARGSSSNGAMAASQPAQGNSATVAPDWASRAAAGLDEAILGQPASGRPASSQPASAQPSSPQPASGQPPSLALTSDVPAGGGKILADKKIVITQPRAGSFQAFTAVCTHQGCTVSSVSGGTINCPCHGSKFSLTNGSVVAGPAPSALAPVSIKVQGTSIVQA
ncbi:MAG TPA: Rieske (2Fe-2S) protein [Streptosporangiaceae bacterium]|jgi:Rieske Fe-S protein